MTITHEEYISKLSQASQKRIKKRTAELLAQEMTLRELRKARELSQETLAEILDMRQGDLSKFERRTDAYLSMRIRMNLAGKAHFNLAGDSHQSGRLVAFNLADCQEGLH